MFMHHTRHIGSPADASLPPTKHLQLHKRPSKQRQHQSGDQHPHDRQPGRLLRLVEGVEQTAQFADIACRLAKKLLPLIALPVLPTSGVCTQALSQSRSKYKETLRLALVNLRAMLFTDYRSIKGVKITGREGESSRQWRIQAVSRQHEKQRRSGKRSISIIGLN